MALQINNYTGFESQGAEEADSVTGSVTYPTTGHRSGDACLFLDSASESYELPWFASGITDAGGDYIFGTAIKFDSLTEDPTAFLAPKEAGGRVISLRVGASSKIEVADVAGTVVITSSDTVGTSNYHFIELYFQNSDNGSAELFIDGVSQGTASAKDFSRGDVLTLLDFQYDGNNSFKADDVYILSGATSAADRYGDFAVKAYQSTDVGATDQGDTLADGTWALVSETPGNEGVSNDAQYQDDTGPNLTGSTITDGGTRSGPSGDSDVTGATIKGAKYVSNLKRGGGAGRVHTILHGNSGDGVTATADLGLTTDYIIYEVLSESASIVPTESESMQMGFSKSATAGQDIICGDQWAMLGYVPAVAGFTGEGSLDAANTNVTGEGVSSSAGDGALDSAAATLSGEGLAAHLGEGDLASAASTLAGEGTVADAQLVGQGALAAAVATLAGEGLSQSVGEGTLAAAAATLAGEGALQFLGEGSLAAQAATIAGLGVSKSVGSGILAADKPSSIIEQHTPTTTGIGFGLSGNNEKLAQSFTGVAGTVINIAVVIDKNGSPTDNIKVSVQSDSSGDPSGSELGSGTILNGAINNDWQIVKLSSAVDVTSGNIYHIVVERTGALGVPNFIWRGDAVAGYSDGELREFDASWQLSSPPRDATFKLYQDATISGTGVVGVKFGEGDLAATAATLAGEGTSQSVGEGALDAAVATVAGEGRAAHLGEGALDAADATLDGSGAVAYTGEGSLTAQAAEVSGLGLSESVGEGVLESAAAILAGDGVSKSIGEGSLASAVATLDGTGTVGEQVRQGEGDLAAQDATMVGTGLAAHLGEGDLVSAAAIAAGVGLSLSEAEGALVSAAATLAGEGISSASGQGNLAASTFTIAGAGLSISKGQGDLASAVANVNGDGFSQSIGDGALSSSAATLSGTGRVAWLGVGSLEAQDSVIGGEDEKKKAEKFFRQKAHDIRYQVGKRIVLKYL
ncbi:hypothetical protein LCGC14_1158680, partial [marine sediment metagenome]